MVAKNREQPPSDGEQRRPHAFLSYASEDKEFAEQVAKALQEKGIETWWDKWEIRHGDSIRQKVDEGIAGCTHFLVLLTHQSICKPWVSTEMDAAFVRKLEGKCRFIPVRYKLHVSDLPPTLQGMLSPKIESGTDIDGLISDIYEISKKPALGVPPAAVQQAQKIKTGYSPAVQAVAKLLVEESKNGLYADPSSSIGAMAEASELKPEDAEDAVRELENHDFLRIGKFMGARSSQYHVSTKPSLFVEFDRYFMGWDATEDAVQIATDIVNDKKFTTNPEEMAKQYGWSHRRLNPALKYLVDKEVIHDASGYGRRTVIIRCVKATSSSALRRFLREHQS